MSDTINGKEQIMRKLINLLKRKIESGKISKTEFSQISGLSRPTIDKVLRGERVHLEIYQIVAKALGKRIKITLETNDRKKK